MPFLPGLAVVFVGIVGGGHGKIDHQVKSLVKELHVAAKVMPEGHVKALTHHKGDTKEIIKKLHAEGVVGFEVVGGKELRLVTYDGDGALKTYLELTLEGGALGADDLQTVKDSIADDFALAHVAAPAPAPEIEIDAAPVAKAIEKSTKAPVKAAAMVAPATQVDDEMPSNLAKPGQKIAQKSAPAPVETKHEPPPIVDDTQTATPTDGGVSVAEIEAATGNNEEPGAMTDAAEVHASANTESTLHIAASLGVGVTGRLFSPGPTTITGYSSTPVGLVRADGHIEPTRNTRLDVVGEKTISMSTPMASGDSAPTSMARWEASGGYVVTHGSIEIAPTVGFGRRTFSIESTDPSRTPDGEYNYLIAGVNAAMPLGGRFALKGLALFEPVISGAEPTEMALGDASRWALDLGAAVEVRFTHLYARAGADWQRFSWSWDAAGARGAGGAVDNYASGTLSLGATY